MTDAPPPPPNQEPVPPYGQQAPYPPPPPTYGYQGGYPPPPPVPGSDVYAPWWKRLLAALIDGLLLGIPLSIIGNATGMIEIVTNLDNEFVRYEVSPAFTVLTILVACVYSAILEGGPRGATVGKMALGIQLRSAEHGGSIGPGPAALRRLIYNLLFLALVIPGIINGLSPLWDARKQAWHDKAVNSVVVNAR